MSRYRYCAKTDRFLVFDEKTERWKPERKSKAKDKAPAIGAFFMPDIKPFVANAADKPVEITSRSQLGAYERSNNIRQAGDHRPGEMIDRAKSRTERDMREASRLARDTRLNGKVKHFEWQ